MLGCISALPYAPYTVQHGTHQACIFAGTRRMVLALGKLVRAEEKLLWRRHMSGRGSPFRHMHLHRAPVVRGEDAGLKEAAAPLLLEVFLIDDLLHTASPNANAHLRRYLLRDVKGLRNCPLPCSNRTLLTHAAHLYRLSAPKVCVWGNVYPSAPLIRASGVVTSTCSHGKLPLKRGCLLPWQAVARWEDG